VISPKHPQPRQRTRVEPRSYAHTWSWIMKPHENRYSCFRNTYQVVTACEIGREQSWLIDRWKLRLSRSRSKHEAQARRHVGSTFRCRCREQQQDHHTCVCTCSHEASQVAVSDIRIRTPYGKLTDTQKLRKQQHLSI